MTYPTHLAPSLSCRPPRRSDRSLIARLQGAARSILTAAALLTLAGSSQADSPVLPSGIKGLKLGMSKQEAMAHARTLGTLASDGVSGCIPEGALEICMLEFERLTYGEEPVHRVLFHTLDGRVERITLVFQHQGLYERAKTIYRSLLETLTAHIGEPAEDEGWGIGAVSVWADRDSQLSVYYDGVEHPLLAHRSNRLYEFEKREEARKKRKDL